MNLSAKEAAKQVGMSKQNIIRAIHRGQLSATRNENNEFVIDSSELFRVFQPATTTVTSTDSVVDTPALESSDSAQYELALLRERLNDKDAMLRDKDDVIRDLRHRLDAEAEERRKLTMILTDTQKQVETPKSWWQRLFGA